MTHGDDPPRSVRGPNDPVQEPLDAAEAFAAYQALAIAGLRGIQDLIRDSGGDLDRGEIERGLRELDDLLTETMYHFLRAA